jgi:hypothetical protein
MLPLALSLRRGPRVLRAWCAGLRRSRLPLTLSLRRLGLLRAHGPQVLRIGLRPLTLPLALRRLGLRLRTLRLQHLRLKPWKKWRVPKRRPRSLHRLILHPLGLRRLRLPSALALMR